MSLVLDIGQGAGLAGGTGIRPFLPPLLAGALARADTGLDFEGTDYAFLEGTGFLVAVLALAVLAYALERRGAADALGVGIPVLAAVLGGLLFAGVLAAEGRTAWPGLAAGAACALLAHFAAGGLLAGARRRLDDGSPSRVQAAGLVPVAADLAALALAGLSVLAPPVGLVATALLAWVLVRSRRGRTRKHEGLRVLR